MAYLHSNLPLFEKLAGEAAREFSYDMSFVIKDYYAMTLLQSIAHAFPDVVFRGGTSLSKCHHVIDRFSEDIDIGSELEHLTQGQKRKFKAAVVDAVNAVGLAIANPEEIRSRRDFNRYVIPLPAHGRKGSDDILLETAVMLPAQPAVMSSAQSYIGEYCERNGLIETSEKYGLQAFPIRATSLERTFCDKTFALCDCYLLHQARGTSVERQSRHLYDLHMLLPHVELNDELFNLYKTVREQRKGSEVRPSASDNVCLTQVATELAESELFERDYHEVTQHLLFSPMDYAAVLESFKTIIAFLKVRGW